MKLKKVLFISLCGFLLNSCYSSGSYETKTHNGFIGKSLAFPEEIECGIESFLDSASKKIITFINGDCSSCIGELKLWKKYYDNGSFDQSKCLIKFIVYTPNPEFAMHVISSNVAISSELLYFTKSNSFFIKNGIPPMNNNLHTFLLDENNQVLLEGNPTKSIDLLERYHNAIMK